MLHRNWGHGYPYESQPLPVSRSATGPELEADNQRIDDMSFKDLTARAAAAFKPKPAEAAAKPQAEPHETVVDKAPDPKPTKA